MKVKGKITFIIKRKDGSVIVRRAKNLLTSLGLNSLAELLTNNTLVDPYNYVALGDGSTAPTESDTALENELLRRSATIEQLTGADANKCRFNVVWNIGEATGTFREIGIFNKDIAGTMLNRSTFTDIVVTDADSLVVQWDIEFSN